MINSVKGSLSDTENFDQKALKKNNPRWWPFAFEMFKKFFPNIKNNCKS